MKSFLRAYFSFSSSERNGIIVLLAIILLLLAFRIFYTPSNDVSIDFSEFEKKVSQYKQADNVAPRWDDGNQRKSYLIPKPARTSDVIYFDFNPNNLPEEKWKALGLSPKQIRVIKNYEGKGGSFKSKLDVKKMYCLSESEYELLAPYIVIPKKGVNENLVVNLNKADSVELLTIKGIGPYYAGKIIRLRSKYGGISNFAQLLELWEFDEEKLNALKDQVSIDINDIKKVNVNTCTVKELKHPYLSWNQANAIINYRNNHGKFVKLDQLLDTDVINKNTFALITPYLCVE